MISKSFGRNLSQQSCVWSSQQAQPFGFSSMFSQQPKELAE
ncbi:hypothetical protein XACM_1628 [Xanthomonas euvesicatoria pv. citrumelo F1]|nr:hypothetical protein XACM_1628 [Xanthomonas euvesicatoria pv. citrumelo F1]